MIHSNCTSIVYSLKTVEIPVIGYYKYYRAYRPGIVTQLKLCRETREGPGARRQQISAICLVGLGHTFLDPRHRDGRSSQNGDKGVGYATWQ